MPYDMVCMVEVDEVKYNGIVFRRYPDSDNPADRKYYRPHSDHIKDGVEALHREVWKDHNGEIPEDHHIHHIDGDPSNNDIENLECLSPAEHLDKHGDIGGIQSEEHQEKMLQAAKEWHKSEEGSEWHKQHGEQVWEDMEAKTGECDQCGDEFEYYTTARFCSNACKSAWRRDQGLDDVERECPVCGEAFETNKYSGSETCSRSCGMKLSWERRSED